MNNKSKLFKINNNLLSIPLEEDTMYKNGFQLGLLTKNLLNKNFYSEVKEILWNKIKNNKSNLIVKIIENRIKTWINSLKNEFKISIQDIIGFSDALEIDFNLVLEINILVEVIDYMCTLLGVISEENSWNLRILDLDNDFINIVKKYKLPLVIISYNQIEFKYIGFLGFFNAHTTISGKKIISTFSWNKLETRIFLKNEIPPIFNLRYAILEVKEVDKIYEYLSKKNINYDGYVMFSSKELNLLYDFDKVRNNSKIKSEGHLIISDFSFNISYKMIEFIENDYKNIPSDNRCFGLIYDFVNEEIYLNFSLDNNHNFEKINLNLVNKN